MLHHSGETSRQETGGDSDDGKERTYAVDDQDSTSIIPHTWLSPGKLLRLLDPTHSGNYSMFLRMWRKEFPVIISCATEKLNKELWNPECFSHDFGKEKIEITNCISGEIISDQPMQLFWDGFENVSRRPKDKEGAPMLLKMKEWPQCTNFHRLLPNHMKDLHEGLPLSSYTHPNGLLNFINVLPNGFLTQDLGTELLCAYGTTDCPSVGTKNLHISITDAIHTLVYVGKNKNEDDSARVLQAIQDTGCTKKSSKRRKKNRDVPGAIWHIYNPHDVKKINDLLKKVLFARGIISHPHEDFLKNEKWYLDKILRERLARDYNVKGHAILQRVGDTIIIPAGAPHQIRNLKSCIMIKHDFISLQNVKKLCGNLSQSLY